ncbi:MAG: transcription-repair coupling factor, partial [Verrucomicrobiota bacterium]
MQDLCRRVELGGALSFSAVSPSAQSFLAALLSRLFPSRTVVVVTDGLKTQESFQQDIETWLALDRDVKGTSSEQNKGAAVSGPRQPALASRPLFYPAWESLPHESKLPHADVVSDRLETLVALSGNSKSETKNSNLVVTSVTALLQRTFLPEEIRRRTRSLRRGEKIEPLDWIEWLEEQGYEPEAQVTQRGEISLRGGIVDLWPLTSPWPVRLEFFGDDLESLRTFDPFTQISKDEIVDIQVPPAGELGILQRGTESADREKDEINQKPQSLGTLLDYLPHESIFLFCEPELMAESAQRYQEQVPADDPFCISWEDFLEQITAKTLATISIFENEGDPEFLSVESERSVESPPLDLEFQSLEVFRPIGNRPPEPQVA